jgi:hypothetical protein
MLMWTGAIQIHPGGSGGVCDRWLIATFLLSLVFYISFFS